MLKATVLGWATARGVIFHSKFLLNFTTQKSEIKQLLGVVFRFRKHLSGKSILL